MTQIESSNGSTVAAVKYQNGHASNHLVTSSASSSPLINTQNKLIHSLSQRPGSNPPPPKDDFSINLSSIQHAIDNSENMHNFTADLVSDADFSYKNLLSAKIDVGHQINNGFNSITSSATMNSNLNDIKVQVYYCGK